MNKLNFIKNFLDSQPSEIDGYNYKFINVKPNKDFVGGVELTVEIETDDSLKPYSMSLFVHRIREIMSTLSEYLGENVPYSLRMNSDSLEEPDGNHVYVPKDIKTDIIKELNDKLKYIEIPSELGLLKINLYYVLTEVENRKMFYQDSVNDSITFNLPIKVTRITSEFSNKELIPNPEKINLLAGAIDKYLINSEQYGGVDIRDNILYDKLKDIQFSELEDLYIDTNVIIIQILGQNVKPDWEAQEIERDYFIE